MAKEVIKKEEDIKEVEGPIMDLVIKIEEEEAVFIEEVGVETTRNTEVEEEEEEEEEGVDTDIKTKMMQIWLLNNHNLLHILIILPNLMTKMTDNFQIVEIIINLDYKEGESLEEIKAYQNPNHHLAKNQI